MGAGTEETLGKADTEGFPFTFNDLIMFDNRGFRKLILNRNVSRRFHQSSMSTVQSWRANCDVKFLVYDTHPLWSDMREICNVADYIVSYTCKGHQTLTEQRDIMASSLSR